MPKMKAKDNAGVPTVSLPSTSQGFPLGIKTSLSCSVLNQIILFLYT